MDHGIRYHISKLGQPLSRRWVAGLGLLDMGQRISVVVILACHYFKLDASMDATVEIGSKGVRGWYREGLTRVEAACLATAWVT
jgi:hypothetical protein